MSDEEYTVLICASAEWGAREKMLPGTVQGVCHDCGQPIWIAPSGLKLQAEHDAITVCGPCGTRSISEIGDLTQDQLRELAEYLKGGGGQDDPIVI